MWLEGGQIRMLGESAEVVDEYRTSARKGSAPVTPG
jgi:ABC-type polysaccharide/polyol phosphate transport system ATPase subunit